jgi:hypothetical protein
MSDLQRQQSAQRASANGDPEWLAPETVAAAMRSGTGRGIKIAVIDSGIELSHPALQGLELADDLAITHDGVAVNVDESHGVDLYGHGTAIAHIIRKIAPEAEIGSFRVLGENLRSKGVMIRKGVELAFERGYEILNCSFGCRGEARFILPYKEWVDEAYLRGTHIVSACNNNDFRRPEWPGHFSSVITVNHCLLDSEEVYRTPNSLVEFIACGEKLRLPWIGGIWRTMNGSSYAAPHMTGFLARILSECGPMSVRLAKEMLHQTIPVRPDDSDCFV